MKRKKKDSSGSLDSLLDTITTVVGILIILLIVVQLGADSAVKRIVDEKKEEDSKKLMDLAMKQFDEQKRFCLKWTKLDTGSKLNRITHFIKLEKIEKNLSDAKERELKILLTQLFKCGHLNRSSNV